MENTIELIRENVYDRSSKFWDYSDNTSSHQPKAILGDKNYLRFLKEYNPVTNAGAEIVKGYNKIFFGAPGTGKSYSIAKKLKGVSEEQIERVIFHPDYDYSSFVGGYKPVTEKDEDGKDVVKYKFVPQVFTNIFEKAHRNPNKNFYLVIEEINRGNCAETFGDIFQLLDRNPDYAITPSEDLHKYLKERDESARFKVLKNEKITMPDNLVILATMNTSDQSLFPMDSAFKRRWDWEYVAIKYPMDEKDLSCPSFSYRVKLEDGKYFKWMDFVANVNKHILQNPSLGVDKCIGNFFVKPDKENIISLDTFINKVIFYLWNDVFKDEENEIFADHTYLSYFPQIEGQRRINEMIEKFRVQSGGMFFFKFNSEGVEVTADIDLGK
ncbi:McrB family protein [Sphingobacterium multivorum]|uniref:McrB family protein n=1 Tax=Sphingobacterium multivorum TaxID=28454 RepID=UPI00301A8B9C